MTNSLSQLKTRIENWATKSHQDGVINDKILNSIQNISIDTPASLFGAGERPLVVGLFGGTGVGKSTLLNRLAGESIARASVERPTSREVTMYLHNSVQISNLPKKFPVDKILTSQHNRAEHRHLLWIDMPDFDSIEEKNRALVEDWLPHIDVLLYVVSPERYKDDNGWRLLLSHGHRHAWMFIMNHWDRGHDVQRSDFETMLKSAGLKDPLLFCTDCSDQSINRQPSTDDFDSLKSSVQSLADDNTIAQLEARGVGIRTNEMQEVVDRAISSMGKQSGFDSLKEIWVKQWESSSTNIHDNLRWKFPLMAKPFESEQSGFLSALLGAVRGKGDKGANDLSIAKTDFSRSSIFDNESIDRIANEFDQLSQQSADCSLPTALVKKHLTDLKPDLSDKLNDIANRSLRESIAKPGTAVQRLAHSMFGMLGGLLPLAAMIWSGYRIVEGFYRGGSEPGSYLGTSFAVNALLLIGLAWALPYFLRLKTRPSIEKAAIRGLNSGTATALIQVDTDVREQLAKAASVQVNHLEEANALFGQSDPAPERLPGKLDRVLLGSN